MSPNPVYKLHNLTQTYDERTVLNIERLDIFAGEILAIVGPSGAGKSTLLRHLNFLERPASGSLRFEAFHLNGEGAPLNLRRKITTVFQNPVLLTRSVADNVAYGLKLRGKTGDQVKRIVDDALDLVGLNNLTHTGARTLSGGEAQRVALARALVIQPSVLLLDEPTANLDPYNVKLIENIITQVNREQGTTIVIVTHNIFQAKRLAHRTALLLEGRLVEIAETGAFFSNPSDPRTEAFIHGEMVY
ncbi:MAG TPA: phosphate ABC transporter ATP-binding protein [Anaerolineae bacterium]|nr:phosphate ABC transporter ATP-binding protein [Anaerolineae bacterium]MCB9108089.1 phosphate ABC transporter ATP-binding protein [Anaerolineales bacterium]HRV92811.1 phosphate ABC transporter ATP-binding protein [Anaerolineae bacterium]